MDIGGVLQIPLLVSSVHFGSFTRGLSIRHFWRWNIYIDASIYIHTYTTGRIYIYTYLYIYIYTYRYIYMYI
jgi:hypothetical protein